MLVTIFLSIVFFYFVAGTLFVIPFLIKGIYTIDAGAHGSSKGFYIIIIPGIITFWPLLLRKWVRAKSITKNQAPEAGSDLVSEIN